jgi:hypothetical protein
MKIFVINIDFTGGVSINHFAGEWAQGGTSPFTI